MHRLISPGDLVADLAGIEEENRQILRMFVNTLTWGAIGVVVVLCLS